MNAVEMLAALTIAALGTSAVVPAVSGMLRSARLNGLASDLSSEMAKARMEAVARGAYTGIRFEATPDGGRFTLYLDGGDRGIRSAEIAAGVDTPLTPPREVAARHHGVRIGIAPQGPVPRVPPASGLLQPTDDPIAFGGSDIYSCSPTGETSTGTLYMTDGVDMRAIVAFGPTGRMRLASWDASARRWRT